MNLEKFNELMKVAEGVLVQSTQEWRYFLEFAYAYFKERDVLNPIVVEIGVEWNRQKLFYESILNARHIGIDISDAATTPDILGDSHAPEILEELKTALAGRTIDLLFIDADHDYQSVRQDYEMFAPLVKGLVAFHDIVVLPGPQQLWQELIDTAPDAKCLISINDRSHLLGIGIMADP